MFAVAARVVLILALPLLGAGKCLCCRGDQATAEEGFCKWWSAKHAKVEALGVEAIGNAASLEARRLYIAYFRTHARLEDPLMWNLFRECPAFNTTEHEPLLRANENEEDEIRTGLDVLEEEVQGHCNIPNLSMAWAQKPASAVPSHGCSSNANASALLNSSGAWGVVREKVAAHTVSEERLLKDSGLLEACEAHLDRRWTEVMEETHQDAQILYDEFRKMDLSLVQILQFVRGMVADWPSFPELRLRTALRMRQVRHRMPEMLESSNGVDILGQMSPSVLVEYVRWVQLERAEGLELDVLDEIRLHIGLLPRLAMVHSTAAVTSAMFLFVPVLAFIAKTSGKKSIK